MARDCLVNVDSLTHGCQLYTAPFLTIFRLVHPRMLVWPFPAKALLSLQTTLFSLIRIVFKLFVIL